MARRDLFHEAVKVALQKENWVIIGDPRCELDIS
ncbi:MAG TPA: hypothetical protein DD000_22615 [Cyanobacteria bacterium UBA11166]|nr:hypothetical protein [Cyanobacteria bacterium UBA11166]